MDFVWRVFFSPISDRVIRRKKKLRNRQSTETGTTLIYFEWQRSGPLSCDRGKRVSLHYYYYYYYDRKGNVFIRANVSFYSILLENISIIDWWKYISGIRYGFQCNSANGYRVIWALIRLFSSCILTQVYLLGFHIILGSSTQPSHPFIELLWFIYAYPPSDFSSARSNPTASPKREVIVSAKIRYICGWCLLCFWTMEMISTIFTICFTWNKSSNTSYNVHLINVHIRKYIYIISKDPQTKWNRQLL